MRRLAMLILALCLFPLTALADLAQPPSSGAAIRMAPPEPPAVNPHPPQSVAEQRRVDFAVQEIRRYYGTGVEIRHPHVIPWSWERFQKTKPQPMVLPEDHADPNVIVEAQVGKEPLPPAPKVAAPSEAAMPAPPLKDDEFMVHAYVRFPQDPRWYHLDVILTEDASGRLSRRNFFTLPMPADPGRLPPGVVC